MPLPVIHILEAPSGAGMTSRCIRSVAEGERTYADHVVEDKGGSDKEPGR